MHFQERLNHIYFILLCVLAFSISLPFIFSSVSVVLIALCWLLQFRSRDFVSRLLSRKLTWLSMLFYLLLAISYFYSDDKTLSANDLQKKLSLIVLPLAIGLGPALSSKNLEYLFASFISGLGLVGLFCMGRGTGSFLANGSTEKLFYHGLVSGLNANAVYYASYGIFATGLLLLFRFERTFLAGKTWRMATLLVTTIFFVLLSSKSLLVLLVVFVLPLYCYRQFSAGNIRVRHLLWTGAIALAGIATLLATENPIKNRYKEILVNNSFVKGTAPTNGQELVFNNFSLRVFLWKMAWENMHAHNLWLTGCGNGDVVALQKERIEAYNAQTGSLFKQPDLSHFNLHNTYLQTLLTIGIPGLLVFCLMTLLPFRLVRRTRHGAAFLVFLVTYLVFMLQESALQTQAGIVYYSFFSQVLLLYYYTNKEQLAGSARA